MLRIVLMKRVFEATNRLALMTICLTLRREI